MKQWETSGGMIFYSELGNDGSLPRGLAYLYLQKSNYNKWFLKVWSKERERWLSGIDLKTSDLEEAKAKALLFL